MWCGSQEDQAGALAFEIFEQPTFGFSQHKAELLLAEHLAERTRNETDLKALAAQTI